MRLALVIAVALVAGVIFVQPGGAGFYDRPRQLPWPTGVQHTISGNSFACETHDRLTATSVYNADYFAIDFGIGLGQPVSSVAIGRVIIADDLGDNYGNKVVLDHGTGIYSVYTHLDSFGSGITVGTFVPQGKVLGYAGYTGLVLPPGPGGTHLHFHMEYDQTEFISYAMNPGLLSGYSGFGSYGTCGVPSPSYTSSQPDTDLDDYPDNHENYLGTNRLSDCPLTRIQNDEVDSWPPDFDDNQVVNSTDVFQVMPPILGSSRDAEGNWSHPSASDRNDLAPSGVINVTDVFKVLPPTLGTSCTP